MNRHLFITALFAGVTLFASESAFALRSPKPLATDARIQTVMYSPNEVYKFIGNYGYQSSIELGEREQVVTISLGDSVSWMVNPMGNRIFLKPIKQDATTNMTVVTNQHTYFFELHAQEAEDPNDKDMIFALRFMYPNSDNQNIETLLDSVPEPEIDDHPEKYNFNYSVAGPEPYSPVRIFDDGVFTYFEFSDKNAEIPAFFLVDSDGSESVVNFRTRGNYIVVERVAPRFTLRNGNKVVCVYNDTMELVRAKAPSVKDKVKKTLHVQ